MIWIEKGGPIVWILIAYSVIGLSILATRYLQLWLTHRINVAAPFSQWREGAEKRIVVGLRQKKALQQKHQQHDGPELRATAGHLIHKEMTCFEGGLKTVSVLANTAPLLGLLGTIIGMIKAFQVIENAGGKVDAMALAGGIWEAMLTTGVGLGVAIPLLILLHLMESALTRHHWRLQQAAALVVEVDDLSEQLDEDQNRSLNSSLNEGQVAQTDKTWISDAV